MKQNVVWRKKILLGEKSFTSNLEKKCDYIKFFIEAKIIKFIIKKLK